MATPKIIADFETQLATALAVGGTSFTLASATDDDGVALPAGLYYFTVDSGTSNKEYLAGTLSGTSVTSVLTVSRQGSETSGAAKAHRVGASVVLTDFATYKKYMDEISLVSAPDASTSAKGVLEAATLAEVRARTATGSTGAVLAVTPDVMDDLPSSDEKAAMAGGGDFGTPSTSNKFLTEDSVSSNTVFPSLETIVFTSSGTWTKDAGLKYVIVELVGGGGGGGSIGAAGSGSGGSAGGYSRKKINAADLSSTETVTVGAGGVGTYTAETGGGTTSFGAHCSATGGSAKGGAPGSGSGGDINLRGGSGGVYSTYNGEGGDSFFGGGGYLRTTSGAGHDGLNGGGGSGAYSSSSGVNTGGAGGAGMVIVTEYYS